MQRVLRVYAALLILNTRRRPYFLHTTCSTMPNHQKTHGYAFCIHQCVVGGCLDSLKNALWTRNGSPLRKHAVNRNLHANCNQSCRGHRILGLTSGRFQYQRIATPEEVAEAFPYDFNNNGDEEIDVNVNEDSEEDDPMIVDESFGALSNPRHTHVPNTPDIVDHESLSIDTNETNAVDIIDLNAGGQTSYTARRRDTKSKFTVIYVPDPTRCHSTVKSALDDLAFLKTSIDIEDWKSIKGLTGSVFKIKTRTPPRDGSVTVCMQEWVSP
jgi:hypothetical protein